MLAGHTAWGVGFPFEVGEVILHIFRDFWHHPNNSRVSQYSTMKKSGKYVDRESIKRGIPFKFWKALDWDVFYFFRVISHSFSFPFSFYEGNHITSEVLEKSLLAFGKHQHCLDRKWRSYEDWETDGEQAWRQKEGRRMAGFNNSNNILAVTLPKLC